MTHPRSRRYESTVALMAPDEREKQISLVAYALGLLLGRQQRGNLPARPKDVARPRGRLEDRQ